MKRSPQTRSRASSRVTSRGRAATHRSFWRCPRCQKTFITRNMWHSCRVYDLERLFVRSQTHVRELYSKVLACVKGCGPITVNPGRRGIALQVRVRALGCVPKRSHLELGLAFRKPVSHPRFFKVVSYTGTFHAHWLRLERASDIDAQVRAWIRRAYATAAQQQVAASR